jgi:hypothetical protein
MEMALTKDDGKGHQPQHSFCLSHIALTNQDQIVVIFPPTYIASYLN